MNGSRTLVSVVIVITSVAIWLGIRSPRVWSLVIDQHGPVDAHVSALVEVASMRAVSIGVVAALQPESQS